MSAKSLNTPNKDTAFQGEDFEMQDTQASSQQPTVSAFQGAHSPGAAQFKIAVNLVPNTSNGTNVDMVCDTVLTESHQLTFGQN